MDRYEYKAERRVPHSVYWCCTYKEKFRCKARLVTVGEQKILVKSLTHNHPPTFVKENAELIMKTMKIKYWPRVQSLLGNRPPRQLKRDVKKDEGDDSLLLTESPNPLDEAKKVIEFLMHFDGYVHFREGLKHDIMVLDNFEYKMERQTTPSNLSWCCIGKEKYKCKARLVTVGDIVIIKSMSHNHRETFPNKVKDYPLRAEKVHIEYKPGKERQPKKENEDEKQSELVKFIISFENEDEQEEREKDQQEEVEEEEEEEEEDGKKSDAQEIVLTSEDEV